MKPGPPLPTGALATALGLVMGVGELCGGFLGPLVAGWASDAWGLQTAMFIAAGAAAGVRHPGVRCGRPPAGHGGGDHRSTSDGRGAGPDSVRVRMQRQQVLYQGKDIEVIVSQHALRHPVAAPDAMLGQLDRLMSAVDIPGLKFGVLPDFRRLPNITMNGFTMLDDVVQVEQVSAELTIEDPEQVAIYHRLMDRLWQVACEGDEARAILRKLAVEYRHQAEG
ncbi:Scr1 family TA system antitoxin-like transcriptional regulator [Saccharopolyspora elongata]|uniref:Scr1 family TA system antitoxin-like transcriptional regulator n=1 Tax=Saccharopolyspora elongata TaxID=2530387 RepID=UPI001A9D29F0|nr:Scr1 family TA system antitoxin-like transcriptional regulator [Saccharopolyspora elongata]